ncbi:MAG: flippase-like domain-containing protein [Candidatus Aminicenantes bacterium]|nr:flippase-like domain-containing protein [Candidatus Aminicenantes bacterium]
MAKKHLIRLGVILILTAVFMYFFIRSVPWGEALRYLTDINVPLFVLSIVLVPLHLLTRGFRWRYLLLHEKPDVRTYNLFAANAVGFTVNLIFPGRLGELVKPLYLAKKENLRKGFCLGTVVVERTFDMFTMCALLGMFMIARPLFAQSLTVDRESASNLTLWGVVGFAVASVLLLLTLALYFFKDKTLRLIRVCLRPLPDRWAAKILELIDEFIVGLQFFRSPGNMLMYTLWSFIVWLGIVFYYWIFFMAYKQTVPYFFMIPYCFLVMVGASIPTPGMAGGFHAFSQLGMTSILKINPGLAGAMTVVVHALQLVVTCLVGYAILWKDGQSLFQLKRLGESEAP